MKLPVMKLEYNIVISVVQEIDAHTLVSKKAAWPMLENGERWEVCLDTGECVSVVVNGVILDGKSLPEAHENDEWYFTCDCGECYLCNEINIGDDLDDITINRLVREFLCQTDDRRRSLLVLVGVYTWNEAGGISTTQDWLDALGDTKTKGLLSELSKALRIHQGEEL